MDSFQLLDGSCQNCIRLFAALEETMTKTGPVAILFIPDGSIVLYMEDRFQVRNKSSERGESRDENPPPSLTGKEARRRPKKRTEKQINIPNSNLEIIYKKQVNKEKNRPKGRKTTNKTRP